MPEQIINASGVQYGLVVNPDGSINIAGTVSVTNIGGSIMIGSVSANVDSIYITSGDNINLGTAWSGVGSVVIPNLGSTAYVTGSVAITNQYLGSETWIKAGSIQTYNPIGVGSIYITNQYLGSETYIKAGSVQTYNPVGIGSVLVTNQYLGSETWIKAGSVQTYNPVGIGSVLITNSYLGSNVYNFDFTDRFTQQIDYQGGYLPIYLGWAAPGTTTATAGWQLRKMTYSGAYITSITFGSGNTNFDKVWNNRSGTGESYS